MFCDFLKKIEFWSYLEPLTHLLTLFIIMAHAQPNFTLQESEITDNTDDLEVEDVFNLKFPMSPMSNSELEQFSQQLDDSELLMQTEREEMSQNAAADVEADQILSQRCQRSENRKNNAQLQKEKNNRSSNKIQ